MTSQPSEHQIAEALKSAGTTIGAPRAKSKFRTFFRLSEGDFDQAIKWTAASIHNDAEYEERCSDHGTGYA